MKNIFCLFVVLLLIQTSVFAQTKKAVQEAPPISIQDEYSADAPVNYVPLVPSAVQPKSPLALSGTYEIGVGKTYVKLSDAVNDLVLQGVSGPVTFEFTDANYTDTSVVIGGYAGQDAYPVVFKLASGNPSAKIFFTGGSTSRTWGVRLDSANNVSFIGSTTVGTRPITFEVDTTTGNATRSVFVVLRSDSIRLEGLEVIGFKTFNSTTAARIISQTYITGNTTPNSNIVYTNLLVKRGATFAINGITSTNRDNNVEVSYCDFGGSNIIENFSSSGLQLYFIDNLTIYKNDIQNGKNFASVASGPIGIFLLGGHNNVVISHNKIHNIEKYGSLGGQGSGIVLQTMNGSTPWGPISGCKIYNNMIYDLRNPLGINSTNQFQAVQGVYMGTLTPNSFNTVEFYNNTIYLSGSINPASYYWTPCVLINASLSTDSIKIFNNVLANTIKTTGFNSGTFIFGDFAGEIVSDNNLFWYPHLPKFWSILSFSGDDLSEWQTNTSQDGNSIEQSDPFFVGTTDPHIVASSLSAAEGNASVVGFVTDDIDGNPRSGSTPDLGADEFSGNQYTFALQALIQGFYTDGLGKNNVHGKMIPDTVTVEIRNASSPYALVTSSKAVLDTSGFGVFQMGSWTPGNSYYIVVKHRNLVETWSRAGGEAFNLTAAQYSFVDTAKAYGDNQVKQGLYWCMYNGDVNQDGAVDLSDMIDIDNDNANFVTGYVPTDVDGNNNIDLSDMIIVDNNNAAFVGKITP